MKWSDVKYTAEFVGGPLDGALVDIPIDEMNRLHRHENTVYTLEEEPLPETPELIGDFKYWLIFQGYLKQ